MYKLEFNAGIFPQTIDVRGLTHTNLKHCASTSSRLSISQQTTDKTSQGKQRPTFASKSWRLISPRIDENFKRKCGNYN